jgi:hypothetical protein
MANNLDCPCYSQDEPGHPTASHSKDDSSIPSTRGAPVSFSSQARANEGISDKLKRPLPVEEPKSLDEQAERFWSIQQKGKEALKDNSYAELSEKIAFLTMVVLENKASSKSQTKRLKEENSNQKKGNRVQFGCNSSVLNLLDDASFALKTRNSGNLENVLGNAKQILNERNKMISIAEFGWNTVSLFENHSACISEEDEHKIRRAESVARAQQRSRGAAAHGRGRSRGRGSSNGYFYNQMPYQPTTVPTCHPATLSESLPSSVSTCLCAATST